MKLKKILDFESINHTIIGGLSRTLIRKVINNDFFPKEMKKYQNPSPIPSPLDFLENKKACKSRTYRLML